jgi:hypothetical protein
MQNQGEATIRGKRVLFDILLASLFFGNHAIIRCRRGQVCKILAMVPLPTFFRDPQQIGKGPSGEIASQSVFLEQEGCLAATLNRVR